MSSVFERLLRWQRVHGRQGLPWQGTRDPYRVWLSEIMLQQTQVVTVLAYYPRFLARFPDVHTLAAATEGEVMAMWTGLGYYSRARHLHRCAQTVVRDWGGRFPPTAAQLQTLPGIGPSTAAAIAAFCFGERVSILDGNVKRVMARYLAFEGDLSMPRHDRALWDRVQALLPATVQPDDMAAYTQGLMDLGAGVCSRHQPQCLLCPLSEDCQARLQNRATDFPVKTRRAARQAHSWWALVWRRDPDGAIWLQPRPARGIWAGLHCWPIHSDLDAALMEVRKAGVSPDAVQHHSAFRHELTHRQLTLHPLEVPWAGEHSPTPEGLWAQSAHLPGLGLPAPVLKWLETRWR